MSETVTGAPERPDWEALAKTLRVGSAEEAEKRAFEIANFVVRVENDRNSKLILKTGTKSLELSLSNK